MAGIQPAIYRPDPFPGPGQTYKDAPNWMPGASAGYMPGAPAGFIMNPFVDIPPKPTAAAPTTPVPKPVPGVPNSVGRNELGWWDGHVYTESSSEDQGSSFSGLGYENDQRAEFGTFGDAFSTLTPRLYEGLTGSQAWGYVPGADGGEGSWHHGGLPAGVDPSQQQSAAMYGDGGSRNVNLKNIASIASIGSSLAFGNPLLAVYTAADKFLLGDDLPGPVDALRAVGSVVGSVVGGLGGLFGLNTPSVPTTTWDSYSSGSFPLTVEPLPEPPFTAIEQYDGYGTSYDEPYTGWQDPTDYGYQTDELTWSPGEDVASWSEDLAQAAEAEQWGG